MLLLHSDTFKAIFHALNVTYSSLRSPRELRVCCVYAAESQSQYFLGGGGGGVVVVGWVE